MDIFAGSLRCSGVRVQEVSRAGGLDLRGSPPKTSRNLNLQNSSLQDAGGGAHLGQSVPDRDYLAPPCNFLIVPAV